jgi:superfamily II DNA or RNA helicase
MSEKVVNIIIENEVRIKLEGVDVYTRRELVKSVEYFIPGARYTPAFKLGRWNGCQSFCTIGGRTYLNVLDKILPVLDKNGYEVEITDLREPHNFEFEPIDENYLSHLTWQDDHRMAGQPIVIRDYQVQVINECINNLQGISIAPTSAGKCQPYDSLIKIPGGWKKMGEISVGDIVSLPNGSTTDVIGVYEPGTKDVYEIEFEDGRTARSCLDHIWRVHNHNWTHKWKNISLKEIISYKTTNRRKISVPLASMVMDTSDIELPLDPYLFGALLGDGSFRHEQITFTSYDEHIVNKLSEKIIDGYELVHKSGYDYSIRVVDQKIKKQIRQPVVSYQLQHNDKFVKLNNNKTYFGFYTKTLNELGLMEKYSYEKEIPEIYLNAGYNQRLELLQGLIDTDGYIDHKGCVEFSSTSKKLIENVIYLVRSVGGIAFNTRSKTNKTYKYNDEILSCRDSYTISIYHPTPELLVTLPRKLDRLSKRTVRRLPMLHITNIKKVSTEPVRCIMINHPDHLYVTNDFIVTHNTLITCSLSKIVEKYGRTIVIVPNKNLVQQTEEDYKNIGLDVGVIYGDRKEYDKTHTICTWQSLNVLDKKNKDALDDGQLEVFLNNLVAIICDEVHSVKNMNVLHTLLTTVFANVPIRWGLTGTVPEQEYDQVSLYSAVGPIIGRLSAKELQDAGHLAKCHVNILQTQDLPSFNDYQRELTYLLNDPSRIDWLAKTITEISKTGNTLVLIDRIEPGTKLHELIPNSTFISGKMKSTKRKEHYKDINMADNAVMIATYGTTSTGISINRIFNLVLVEPGKSFVRTIQSIGRGLRKADDKDYVDIWDITSKCKFSNRHLLKRKSFYNEVKYPSTINKITY